jgi:hypothetical protein
MTDILASPNKEQRFLIGCIGKLFFRHHKWPIFEYIEAECDKEGFEAREVLASLPEIPLTGVAGFRYGPIWHNSHYIPSVDAQMQLRMLGLWHLGEPFGLEIVDEFVRVLKFLIERRLSAPYSPFQLNKVTVTNAEIATQFPDMDPAIAACLPELLTHEPTTWQGTQQTDTSGGWSIDIYRGILKYRGIDTAVDYLERVNELLTQPEAEPAPAIPSPLDLVATLDYFNAVWQLHFDRKKPIIRLFGAERTARLVYGVNTAEEFSSQVSCLADILKNMQVSGDGKTPLARMQAFLKTELPGDSNAHIDNAIDALRHVADVRNALFQHSGTEHRGVSALTQLGIDYPIIDWQSAWAKVQQRTIDAFNAIREEIQKFHEIEAE